MHLDNLVNKLSFSSRSIVTKNKNKLIRLESSAIFKNPESMYTLKKIGLDNLINKLNFIVMNLLNYDLKLVKK